MGTVCEEKIPEMENLGKWWGTGAEGQDGREGVEFGVHALGEQVRRELRLDDFEAPIDEAQSTVDAVHGAADVARAFAGDEGMEERVGLDLAAGGVEERRAQDVHALHVDGGVDGDIAATAARDAAATRCRDARFGFLLGDAGRRVDKQLDVASTRRRAGFGAQLLPLFVVERPRDRVEQANQTGFRDTAFEQRIGGEGAEGIVADLRISRGAAAVNEREVVVGRYGGDIQQDEPKVDPICGLENRSAGRVTTRKDRKGNKI